MSGRRDFYEILGIDGAATLADVRAAFRRLARDKHPDRFQGAARQQAETDFQEITEAYNVLSDPDRRGRYDQSLSAGTRETLTNPKEMARALLAKGLGLLKSGDVVRAGEMLHQAVAHDAQSAKAHHALGLFLSEHNGRIEDALRHLDQACKLDPLNPRVLVDSSRLFARARMFVRASRLAESAAELAPGDAAISAWVNELKGTMRAEGAR